MKRFTKLMFVVGSAALLFATTAQAQVSSTSAVGASPATAAVDITLTGVIESSLVLTITPAAGIFASTSSVGMPARSAATFDFGTFNTMSASLTNGSIHRVAAATPGAFAVASLVARATVTGGSGNVTVNLSLGAGGGTSPIAAGNTRFQSGVGTWAASTDGTVLGAGATALCPVGGCVSSTDYTHDLGVFIPDTQGAGNFTQVISYDATL